MTTTLRRWLERGRPRHLAVLCGLLALAAGSPARPATAAEAPIGASDRAALEAVHVVTVRALNLRPEPSLKNEPLTVVQQGEYLRAIERTFSKVDRVQWVHVQRSDGQEGWVSGKYLRPVQEALGVVDGAFGFLASLGGSAPSTPVAAVDKLKVGFVYVGPVGDAGWTYQHDQARQALAKLPFVERTDFVPSVPEDPALALAAIDQLVAKGDNLIFTTSYGFMDPTIAAAKKHPDVTFMHVSGFKTAANAGTLFGRIYEARYLAGLVAGVATKTNKIGYVAAFPIAEVVRDINAFTLGVRNVNPRAEVQVLWTDTWYGPGIERLKGEELVAAGADVLTIHQDTPAVLQVAEQHGKRAIGFHSDMRPFAPSATLTSAVWNWLPLYQHVAETLHAGNWQPEQLWWGLKEGVVDLAPLAPDLPADLTKLVNERRAAIIDGSFHIFEGPITDTAGKIRLPSGKIMSDADLLTMDFFVEGVRSQRRPDPAPVVAEGAQNG